MLWVVRAAVWTVVVPRPEQVWLTRVLFVVVRRPFEFFACRARTVTRREAIRARYGPTTLMLMPLAWVTGVMIGFVPIYWALGADPIGEEFVLSGSSVTTLGFSRPNEGPPLGAAVVEAVIGLGLVALLISFLPTMYGHFSRREHLVAKLSSRAGTPPTPAEMFIRHHRLERLEQLDDMWPDWEDWFVELEESHTTYPALVHFRSIDDHRSWLTGAGAVLDAAALRSSTLDIPRQARAELTIRSGYLALRAIADFFGIHHERRPRTHGSDLDPQGRVRRRLRAAPGRRRPAEAGPGPVLAGLRRLAGQLRPGAARAVRAGAAAARPVVLGPHERPAPAQVPSSAATHVRRTGGVR